MSLDVTPDVASLLQKMSRSSVDVTGCRWMSLLYSNRCRFTTFMSRSGLDYFMRWMSLDVTGCRFPTPMDVTM